MSSTDNNWGERERERKRRESALCRRPHPAPSGSTQGACCTPARAAHPRGAQGSAANVRATRYAPEHPAAPCFAHALQVRLASDGRCSRRAHITYVHACTMRCYHHIIDVQNIKSCSKRPSNKMFNQTQNACVYPTNQNQAREKLDHMKPQIVIRYITTASK